MGFSFAYGKDEGDSKQFMNTLMRLASPKFPRTFANKFGLVNFLLVRSKYKLKKRNCLATNIDTTLIFHWCNYFNIGDFSQLDLGWQLGVTFGSDRY